MTFAEAFRDFFRRLFPPAPPPPYIPPLPEPGSEVIPAKRVILLVNHLRRDHGLQPLAAHEDLTRAAMQHAASMMARRELTHYGPDGSDVKTRVYRTEYQPAEVGEVIAQGQGTAEGVVRSWEDSPRHRDILLGEFRHFGSGRSGDYWCAVFANPL